jgi:hypothetical protein
MAMLPSVRYPTLIEDEAGVFPSDATSTARLCSIRRTESRSRSIRHRTGICFAVAWVMLAACQSLFEARQDRRAVLGSGAA